MNTKVDTLSIIYKENIESKMGTLDPMGQSFHTLAHEGRTILL